VRIRCGRCGHAELIFTTRGDRFGDHHGAICAYCWKPITLKDCLFRQAIAVTEQDEADIFHQLPDKKEKMTAASALAKPAGKR
jgi:hypothetical protein